MNRRPVPVKVLEVLKIDVSLFSLGVSRLVCMLSHGVTNVKE